MNFIIYEHLLTVVGTLISGIILSFVGYMFKTVKGLVISTLAMSHDKLYKYAEFCILTGQITVSEMENLENIYKGYHALGGNGTGTELFEKCKELPVVEKRTVWR